MPMPRTRTLPFALLLALSLVPLAALGQDQAFDLDPGTRVLAPIQFRHLTVFPVVRQERAPIDRTVYLTLSEGLKQQQVQVSERREGATVNQVTVKNSSDKPLIMLGGEIILGGQQDRVLGKDVIVPPHSEAAVQVFCVEHGRWSGGRQFTSMGGMSSGKVRAKAKYAKDQSAVWSQVAESNAKAGADKGNSTGTYRRVVAGADGQRVIKPFRDHLAAALARLPEAKRLVGYIAAINGRVTSVDIFESPQLFASYRDKLLDSIILSAADVTPAAGPSKAPAAADVRGFIADAEAAPEVEVDRNRSSRTVEKRGRKAVSSKLAPAAAPAAAQPAYRSYQAVE
jgi:hypothetical protein